MFRVPGNQAAVLQKISTVVCDYSVSLDKVLKIILAIILFFFLIKVC